MVKALAKLYDRLLTGLAFLGGALMIGMALWVTYEVLMRYLVRRPTIWAVDLSEYAMVWAVFLAGPWLLRHDRHVNIEVVVERLGPRGRQVLGVVTSIVGALVCAVLGWQGLVTVADLWTRGVVFAKEWAVVQYPFYLVIPFGSALLVVEFLRRAARFVAPSSASDA